MPRLKSRNRMPPHGFLYNEPAFGMAKPFGGPSTSFNALVDAVWSARRANKYLAEKHNLSTDRAGVEYDVEQQNVARMLSRGWTDFVELDAQPVPPHSVDSKKNPFANAVGGVKRVAAGVGVLLDWLGSGGKPVEQALAEHRATVCSTCPKNDGGNWTSYFTGPAAAKIKTQLEMKGDLQLKTSLDDKLTVCSACDCPLPLKVHTPLVHVLAHTSEEVKKRFDPRCWVLHEKL